MPAPGAVPLPYHAMRLRWCALALRRFLRRWGAYLVVATLVVGAGANSPVAVVAGAAGWLVLPLFRAAAHGAWVLPAVLAQAAVGIGCVWGMRALLWPAHWGDAERALPLAMADTRRSDALVVACGLLPLWLLQVAGAAAVLAAHPAWLQPARGRALAALLLAKLLALGLGVLLLQRLRRAPRAGRVVAAAPAARAASLRPIGWVATLLVLPLVRGPALRTGRVLALGSAALCLPGAVLWAWPGLLPWMLAALAGGALVVVTRAHALAREELAPLFDAIAPWPLRLRTLERGRALLCLLPLLPACVMLAPGLRAAPLRPLVLLAYTLACIGSCVAEVASRPAEPADKAGRWLFSLVLCICLASEVPA